MPVDALQRAINNATTSGDWAFRQQNV